MIERMIKIREMEGLSQEKFANRIGLSRNFINQAENGKKNLSDRTISDICREFNINEEWLRHGKKPMKISKNDRFSSYLAEIAHGDDDFIRDLVEIYMDLDQASKEALKTIADKMAERRKSKS